MAVVRIYSRPVSVRHHSTLCSKAAYFYLVCAILTVVPPFLLTYRSHGFWMTVGSYREKPNVHFKYQFLYILRTGQDNGMIVWSTYDNFNRFMKPFFRNSVHKAWEEDLDKDRHFDRLHLNMETSLGANETIHSVDLFLVFDYQLKDMSRFVMETMAVIQYNSPLPGSKLEYFGDLALHQQQPLRHAGADKDFNVTIFDPESDDPRSFYPSNVLRKYSARKISTYLSQPYSVWSTGQHNKFVIDVTINYLEHEILYKPSFWEAIKWAWIQYFAVLVVFFIVFQRIKSYVFRNQLVPTIVSIPWKSHLY